MNLSLSAFVPENLISRDGLGSPSRVSLPISILRLNLVFTYGIPPEFRGGIIRHRVSPEFIGSRNCAPMTFTAESPSARASKPQGSFERVLPWQVTMEQLMFASLSHTHYWHEVGILKVPAVYPTSN